MLHRERVKPPSYIYPVHEWKVIEKRFAPEFMAQMESIFSTGNGYLGFRGTFEEGTPVVHEGSFVNGFYESWPIVYGEEAYGFATTGQTIVNAPNGKIVRLYVDDEPFFLPTANLIHFERSLDMQNGTLDRDILWEMPSGKRIAIRSRRFVSFEHRHLAAIFYEVRVVNADAPLVISSEMVNPKGNHTGTNGDPRQAKGFKQHVLRPKVSYVNEMRAIQGYSTQHSKMSLACGMAHVVDTQCSYTYKNESSEHSSKIVFSVDAESGVPVKLFKYITYHTSRSSRPEELCTRAEWTLDRALKHGFETLTLGQRKYLDEFWERSDIRAEADPEESQRSTEEIQQALRFNLYQIFQAAARAEGVGIPAKGLTGQAYEGHYFWDTEIYVLPFLIYTYPHIARNLLKFRHSMLDKARQRALQVNQKGALFPWRTINGDEASAYYAAGTAQYHINADIIYALKKYVNVTGDLELLYREGAEMLVETARLWSDLGFYSKREGGKFCIHGVTGPDEYNTVVNDNAFTNLMARENLRYAVEVVNFILNNKAEEFLELTDKTSLQLSEIEEWRRAAEMMYIPYDQELGIHPQDDSFLDKETWDLENTPPSKYPLLLYHHPLVIYRHQVIKQADVVLAMFLLGHEFPTGQKKRNFEFYDPLTTGDSSLSVCIQSIMAAELGYLDLATEYARYAVLMDLADVGGNVKDGCHIASMGGSWMVFVYGFAGMRDYPDRISFHPSLPKALKRLRFHLKIRTSVVEVDMTHQTTAYTLKEGESLSIFHMDEEIKLTQDSRAATRPVIKTPISNGKNPFIEESD